MTTVGGGITTAGGVVIGTIVGGTTVVVTIGATIVGCVVLVVFNCGIATPGGGMMPGNWTGGVATVGIATGIF